MSASAAKDRIPPGLLVGLIGFGVGQRIAADLHTAREGAALPRAEARVADLDPEHEL